MVSSSYILLKQRHHLHFPYERSIIERTVQYIKDLIEGLDDYFVNRLKNCKIKHMKQCLNLFAFHYKSKFILT